MTFQDIIGAIVEVGFPVMCVLLCFYYIYNTDKRHSESEDETRKSHHEEIMLILEEQRLENTKLVEAINNNTVVMNKVLERIDNDVGHD